MIRSIYCCGCKEDVEAGLVRGNDCYPSREDLRDKYFWKCSVCRNFVGCHKGGMKPLGCIADAEMKNARQHLHKILDPIWKDGKMSRDALYLLMRRELKWRDFHVAEIRTIEDARKAYRVALRIQNGSLRP